MHKNHKEERAEKAVTNQDVLIKALAYNGQVRAYMCQTTKLVRRLCRRHETWPNASVALGRVLSAGVMMAGMLKEEQHQLALEFRGDGPIGRIVVDARADGSVRGYVGSPQIGHPNGEPGTIDVGATIGKEGFLYVLRDTGEDEAYRGTVPLINGEVGSDITYYFLQSEQTPSSVGVGVLLGEDGSVLSAGGFILQLMPGAEEAVIDKLEAQIKQMDSVVKQIEAGVPLASIMHELLGETYHIVEERPLSFRCTCSLRRVERALLSLGAEELRAIADEQGQAEIACDFCREPYRFDRQALQALASQLEESFHS